MAIISIFCYILVSYGLANLFVYSNGPFHIFEKWRNFTHNIHEQVGELFTCMLCLSTWIGLFLSIVNIILLPLFPFTPFNIILGASGMHWLIVLLDMGFTSACVWLLHQLEEMMERTGVINYYDDDNGE